MPRPVGGLDEEGDGVLPAVGPVAPAAFRLPGREDLGSFASGRLLSDAARPFGGLARPAPSHRLPRPARPSCVPRTAPKTPRRTCLMGGRWMDMLGRTLY